MKLVLFLLLVSLISSLVESKRKKKSRTEDAADYKEPLHPAAFSLR